MDIKKIIENCREKVDALKKYLDANGMSLVYDWNRETLVIGPKGLHWIYDHSLPKGHSFVTNRDTQDWFDHSRLLPAHSVFYCNPDVASHSVNPTVCRRYRPLRPSRTNPVLSEARTMTYGLMAYANRRGFSLFYEYGNDTLNVVKGTLYANRRRYGKHETYWSNALSGCISDETVSVFSGFGIAKDLVALKPVKIQTRK